MTRDPRELIRNYRESEWRTTRLKVLRQLGDFQDSRSFHFLTQLIETGEDLAEQQLAITSLARRKGVASRGFLREFYPVAPDTLKSTLAHGLGVVQDLASIPVLIRDWDTAMAKQDHAWLRNILLSLGELKAFQSMPKIIGFIHGHPQSMSNEILFALIFALGRLCRQPLEFQTALASQHDRIQEDALLEQVYQSALSQVQVRSQFKLEDYLNKIFTYPDPHPVMPLELLSFDPEEVDLGLSIFDIQKDWSRFLFALRGVLPERREKHLIAIAEVVGHLADAENLYQLFDGLRDLGVSPLIKQKLESTLQVKSFSPELRLKWLEIDGSFETEANFFLKHSSDELAVRWINGWNEHWNGKMLAAHRSAISAKVDSWIQAGCSGVVHARLIRAAAELGLRIDSLEKSWESDFQNPVLRTSILIYFEKNETALNAGAFARVLDALSAEEQDQLAPRVLPLLEGLAGTPNWSEEFKPYVVSLQNHFNAEIRASVVRILGKVRWNESEILKRLSDDQERVVLQAIIALKSFPDSAEAGEALIPFLQAESEVLRGRALDALCANHSLKSRQAVMGHLESQLENDQTVDKIFRCFDPQKKGGESFVKQLDAILQRNPDHSQWEKLVQLRDRLISATPTLAGVASVSGISQEALQELDRKLIELIPLFPKLDPTVQSALRAAEQPFHQSLDLQNLPVDRAPTVLEYCKALDLILERHLGQKFLFPRIDQNLNRFQTLWHQIGFSEDYPPVEKVLNALGLKGKITPENFPLHKSKLMCATFFNGKIMQDRFKIFDGLRSWAVIFLFFARKIPQVQGTPLLPLEKTIDAATLNEQCIQIAKKLMVLQDLRNPAAHRQTYAELQSVKQMRNEAIQLVNTVLNLIL